MLWQLLKAECPIEDTLLGISISLTLLQSEKALLPIEVMELGMVTEVNPLQL
jgi:hypothetical protein